MTDACYKFQVEASGKQASVIEMASCHCNFMRQEGGAICLQEPQLSSQSSPNQVMLSSEANYRIKGFCGYCRKRLLRL